MNKRILSFLLALVMVLLAVPFLALPTMAEEADIWSETWDESDPNSMYLATRDNVGDGLIRLYVWYDAAGNLLPVDGWPADADPSEKTDANKNEVTVMEDGCYGVFNPQLYEEGILTRDMTWDEVCEAYGAYLFECSRITYNTGWSVGNFHGGNFVLVESRCFVYSALLYGVRKNSKGKIFPTASFGGGSEFSTGWEYAESFFDDYIAKLKTTVQPDENGKIYWTDIAQDDLYLNTKVENYSWEAGAGGMQASRKTLADGSIQYIYGLRPDVHGPVALQYTVPEGIYGTATIDMGSYIGFYNGSSENNGMLALALNGEVVWPAEADFNNITTWYSLTDTTKMSTLQSEIAKVEMDVQPGDAVQLIVARATGGKITVDLKPTINIEKKYLVEYLNKNDEVIQSNVVAPGTALPAAPMASADGFFINGAEEAVTELPATVTEHLKIKYAGDPKVTPVTVEKIGISISEDFAADLYVKGDEYAVRMGVATDYLGEFWGEEQEDGTYKITLPGISVTDLDEDINLYFFQEFAGENNAENNADIYELNLVEVLNGYLTNADFADVKDLAQAALDYHAAAEAHFAGGELDAETAARLAAQDTAIAALAKDVVIEDEYYDYTVGGATLVLQEKVAIALSMALTEFDTLNDDVLDFTVTVNGETFDGFKYKKNSEYNGQPTEAVICLGGIVATDYDTVWEITVYDNDGDQACATISYSVNAYIARTFEGGAGEADNLLRALYALGVAAEALNG